MLANFPSRKVAVVVGLILSTNMAYGQFPSAGQAVERNAYRALQNHLHDSRDNVSRPTGTIAQTSFGESTYAKPITPTRTPTPTFDAPGFDSGCSGDFGAGLGGGIPAYNGPATAHNPATGEAVYDNSVPTGADIVIEGNVFGHGAPVIGSGAAFDTGAVVGSDPVVSGPVVSALSAQPVVAAPMYGPAMTSALGEVPSYANGAARFADYDAGYQDTFPMQFSPSPLAGGCSRFTLGVDYLNWYVKGQKLPALVSTSPVGTGPVLAGRKFEPTTTILFGGDRQDDEHVDGLRVRGSLALDRCCQNRIEFDFFKLGSNDFFFSKETPGDYDILARPFYNPWTGNEDAEFVGYPGLIDGRIDVRGSTDFEGYGVWWRHSLLGSIGGFGGNGGGGCGCGSPCGTPASGVPTCGPSCGPACGGGCGSSCGSLFGGGYGGGALASYGCAPRRRSWMLRRLDLIAGYRHLDLDESVSVREYLTVTDPAGPVPAGTTFDIFDSFNTRNYFDGFDFGLGWEWCRGRLGLSALTKVAFGQVRRVTSINGFTNTTVPGQPTSFYDGGLLALPSNNGVYRDTDFTVVPEVGLNLSYAISCRLRVNFGYSLIFYPQVVRPGGAIDLDVDPRQLPPPTIVGADKPEVKSYLDDFWAQGFNVGLEYCF